MQPASFAAERRARLDGSDQFLRPFVVDGLKQYANGEADWTDVIINAAAQVWLENFQAEAPGRAYQRPLARFRTTLEDTLEKTTQPEGDDEGPAQATRISNWLSTYAVNAGTATGAFGRGIKYKRWTTMGDASVREIHEPLDGVVRPLGGTFDVAGTKLGFPGEPVGPPEVWINCRCVIMPASKEGEAMSATTYVIGPEDSVDENDNPDIEPGYDVYMVQRDWEGGTDYYGPFADRTAAQTWLDAGAAGDGEYGAIALVDGNRALLAAAVVADPTDIAVETADEDELEDGEELITEIPVHGVLAPEGVPTGDGREFAIGALSTRTLPIPLRYETVGTHGGSTSDVVTVGRIDEAWRDDASDMWRFRGAIVLAKPYAQEVIDGLVDGTVRGISIDGDDAEVEVTPMAEGDDPMDALLGMMNPEKTVFSKMRVAGATIVPIPAFQEAYTALGHDFQEDLSDEELAAQQAALQACGCSEGWEIVDVSDSALGNARAAIAAAQFREFPKAQRDKAAEAGHALPDGSFPIENVEDLRNAISAIGRAKDPPAAKAHIKKRARALGHPELIPEDWEAQPEEFDQLLSVGTESFAPGTHDGPGWITHPIPTARIRRYWTRGEGATKIRWGAPGDFNRCRSQLAKYVKNPDWLAGLCANMHYEALGFWPAQHHGSRVITAAGSALASPAARLVPDESEVFPHEWFQNPSLERAVPLRIEKDTRRIYGYVAEWGTCHVGIEGFCQDVPRSYSDYGYFKKGLLDTDAGEISVGVISYGEGHASPYQRIAAATAHYDQPQAVRAYVNLGEDEYGIWFAGVLAPWVSDEDIAAIRGVGAVSGDWREIRGQYELIGVPVVNTPGYPLKRTLAASAGRQVSLIGAGALAPEPEIATFTLTITPEMMDDIASKAMTKVLHQQGLAARAAFARDTVRKQSLAHARARIERS